MTRDVIEGKLKQLKGNIREKWGKLTNDDVDAINGRYEQLAGKLQERYGYSRKEAERQINEWLK